MFGWKLDRACYAFFCVAFLLGSVDAVAQGNPPPVVGALSVSNVQQTSVRLNAQVTTNNASTQVFFQYHPGVGGATWLDGGSTTIPGSNMVQTASVNLGGLACGTLHQFRAIAINDFGQDGPHTPANFTTASCVNPPAVSVSSSGSAQVGGLLTLAANATGQGSLTYEFDIDDDDVYDRRGSQSTIQVTYPSAFDGDVRVRVTDSNGQSTIATRHVTIVAPHLIVASVGTPTQVCGDGDTAFDPGERWSIPVRITNDGQVAENGGYATFSPTDIVTGIPPVITAETHVIMDTPAVPIGNLAPGASIDTAVVLSFAADAPCGARYTLQFSGGADSVGFSTGTAAPVTSFTLGAQCQVFTTCPKSKAITPPRQGLYYNASRAGNGLSNFLIPSTGGSTVYFGAWFTANTDRSPTWYIVQGNLLGAAVKAPILKFTRDLGSATFKANSVEVGRAVVAMIDAQHTLMTWTIGTKQGAEVMEYFTSGAAPQPNRSGAWFSANEPGWGEVIHQFDAGGVSNTFAVDYIYDANAQPRWVIGQDSTATFASGTQQKTFEVHCPGCAWIADWNSFPLASGTASVVFNDSTSGIVSTNLALPAPLSGTWVRNNLPIVILSVPQ